MTNFTLATIRRTFLVCVPAAAIGLAGGCDRNEGGTTAIRHAHDRLSAMSGAGAAGSNSPSHRRQVYTEVLAGIKGLEGSDEVGQAQAANLIIAQCNAGLADIEAQAAAEKERRTLNAVTNISVQFNTWSHQAALAAAAESYNPAGQQAEIEKAIATKDTEIATATAAKRAAEAALAALEKKANDYLAQSKAKRDEAAGIQGRMAGTSAVLGLDLMNQAVSKRREADKADLEASYVRAEIDATRPKVAGMQSDIDRLTRQRESFVKDKASLAARAEDVKKQAAESRASATQAAGAVGRDSSALLKDRAGELAAWTEKAVSLYRVSIAAAKKAGQGAQGSSRSTANLVAASSQHAMGDVLFNKARGIEEVAGMLNTLATSQPPLPDAATYAAEAAKAKEEFTAAIKEARDAFAEAKTGYESAGVSGGPKDRVERLLPILEGIVTGNLASTKTAAAPVKAGDPVVAGGGGGGAEADVRAAIDGILTAVKASDYNTVLLSVKPRNAEGEALLASAKDLMENYKTLDAACTAKFGKSFMNLLEGPDGQAMGFGQVTQMTQGLSGSLGGGKGLEELQKLTSADFDVTMKDGDHADAKPKGEAEGMPMIKDGGTWKIDMAIPAEAAPMIQQFSPILKQVADALKALAGDAEKASSEKIFLAQVQIKMGPIMMQAMSGLGGMGGPPK